MNTDKDVFDCVMGGIYSSTDYERRAINILEPLCSCFMYEYTHAASFVLQCKVMGSLKRGFNITVIVSCLVLWTYVPYYIQWSGFSPWGNTVGCRSRIIIHWGKSIKKVREVHSSSFSSIICPQQNSGPCAPTQYDAKKKKKKKKAMASLKSPSNTCISNSPLIKALLVHKLAPLQCPLSHLTHELHQGGCQWMENQGRVCIRRCVVWRHCGTAEVREVTWTATELTTSSKSGYFPVLLSDKLLSFYWDRRRPRNRFGFNWMTVTVEVVQRTKLKFTS